MKDLARRKSLEISNAKSILIFLVLDLRLIFWERMIIYCDLGRDD